MKSSLFLTLLSICLSFSTFQSLATPSSDEITNFDTLKEAIKIYNEKAPEHELITSAQTYHKFYKEIPGAPYNPYQSIPNFTNDGGFNALLSKETPYRITDFNTLKEVIEAYNQKAPEHKLITSQQTYHKFYKEIPGAPYNPYQSIPNFTNDGGFNALLPKYRITDFNTLKEVIEAYNQKAHEHKLITSQQTYHKFYKEIPGAPSVPYQSIPNFKNDGGFNALLPKYRITDFNTLKVAIDAYNQKAPEHKLITSQQTYYQFYKEIPGAPSDPYRSIPNFKNDGGFNALLSALLSKETPYRITDFNTLKEVIEAYNQKAPEHKLITSQQTYHKFYKEIPGAPSVPYQSIPNFKNDGGFNALLPKYRITDFNTLKVAIDAYNQKAPEHKLITSQQTYYQFYKEIPGAPSDPYLSIHNFTNDGGFNALLSALLSKETPYRITDFNTLKVAIDAYNQKVPEHKLITSAQTYKQFYKEIPGAPSDPYPSIPNFTNDGGFKALLPKYRITDFNTLKEVIEAYNQKAHEHKLITSQKTYYQFYKEIPGAPSDPYQSIPNFTNDGGFKALLPKETPYRITDFNTLKVAIDAYNQKAPEHKLITSWRTYRKFYKEIPGAPSNLYRSIPNFKNDGGFNALLPKETPYRITVFNTLKVAIDAYNQKAPEHKLITSWQTYRKFYKEIPGAPSDPYRSIPNFKNDGRFNALLPKYRITDFNTLKVAIDAYNQKTHEHKLITSKQTYYQFYKEIPGAPSVPYRSIPNFTNDGGFKALLDTCSPNLFSKKL